MDNETRHWWFNLTLPAIKTAWTDGWYRRGVGDHPPERMADHELTADQRKTNRECVT